MGVFEQFLPLKLPDGSRLDCVSDLENYLRSRVCIHCWHASEMESAAMWSIYAGHAGIAVKTTVAALKAALSDAHEQIWISSVFCTDLKSTDVSSALFPFILKRKSFEFEREVRLLYQN